MINKPETQKKTPPGRPVIRGTERNQPNYTLMAEAMLELYRETKRTTKKATVA